MCLGVQCLLVFVIDLLSLILREHMELFYCLVTSREKSAGRLNSIHHALRRGVDTVKCMSDAYVKIQTIPVITTNRRVKASGSLFES